MRNCLRDPVPEIYDAARFLDAAVSAHMVGKTAIAEDLIRLADVPVIRDWSESLWGKDGPWTRPLFVDHSTPFLDKSVRLKVRMPSTADLNAILARDGFHCRFCGIPLVRAETRKRIQQAYPAALRWGDRNAEQHAGLQAMWLQFDHVLPHARGGSNDLNNILVTCAPCNNGRSNLTLEEAGLADPRKRAPIASSWDGLERFHSISGSPIGMPRSAAQS